MPIEAPSDAGTGRQTKPGFCTLCRSRCGTINVIEGGRLVEVRANPDHPTGKATCAKGRAAPEIAHSARRLKYPLKRTAPKGAPDPGFVRISWDEALAEIASRLSRIRDETGPETVAFAVTSGSSSSTSDALDWIQRLIRGFGSPNNVFSTEICNWHKDVAHAFTFGCGLPTADYANAGLILLWGHNPSNVWLAQAEAIGAARNKGAKLAVIDPRQTASARDADLWLRVRPGTDGALALGLSHLLVARQSFDRDFVRNWTNATLLVRDDDGLFLRGRDMGWSERADCYAVWDETTGGPEPLPDSGRCEAAAMAGSHTIETLAGPVSCRPAFAHFTEAVAPYTSARVAEITGIPEHQIEALAGLIATASSVCYHGWTGVGQHTNATQTERAIATLYALTGSFDRPGGNVRMAQHPVPALHSMDWMPREQREKALGLGERPLGPPRDGWITASDLYTAILDEKPYRVRALFGFGSNLLVSHPGTGRGRRALESLEFQVHCDLFLNPTASHADFILPVSSPWENEALRTGFEITHQAQEWVQFRPAMIPPQGEARSDTWIVFELAKRLGLSDLFFGGDLEAGYNHVLAPLGLNVAQLRERPAGIRLPLEQRYLKYRETGFLTETKRAELYSEQLHRHGYPAVPRYVPSSHVQDSAFPLLLFSVNNGYFCHSQHRGINSLRKRKPEPSAAIHPACAGEHGVSAGDWMLIKTRQGSLRVRVEIDPALAPDVVACDYGWWEAAPDLGFGAAAVAPEAPRLNFNDVIGEFERDPLSGALPLRSAVCRIEKMDAPVWRDWRPFIVASHTREAADIVALTLVPQDGVALPPFRPGQSVNLRIGEDDRSYSLTGAVSASPGSYRIAVRHVGGGAVSEKIALDVKAGSLVELRPPAGPFALSVDNEFPIVMIAGGVGITPFMSFLRSRSGAPDEAATVLHYVCRAPSYMAFKAELEEMAKRLPRFRLHLHFTRWPETDEPAPRFCAGDIAQDLIGARARFYICAADQMIKDVTAGLSARGVPKFEIFSERFRPPESPASLDPGPRLIRFLRSGRELVWTPDSGSILKLAETNGVPLPSGCRVGQCGSCAVTVSKGSVVHACAADDLEENECLTCQARPLTDLTVDA